MRGSTLRRHGRWQAVFGALAVAACASGSGGREAGNPFGQDAADRQEIEIRVINLNFSDATVWALVQDGRRERLGIVSGKSDAEFVMSWPFSEDLRIEFDLLAGMRCYTERMRVDPGDLLELQISAQPTAADNCR